MKKISQKQTNKMYERVAAALDTVFTDLPADGKAHADAWRAAFADIRAKADDQTSFGDSAKVGTGARSRARNEIREYRAILAETAGIIARQRAGFSQDFPTSTGETDEELLRQTRLVADKAVAAKADFIKRGLTEEYLASGADLVEEFQDALGTTLQSLSQRGTATGGKKSAYAEASDHFDELDLFIRNHYRDQPDKLNAWRNATHIERSAGSKDDEPVPVDVPPTN